MKKKFDYSSLLVYTKLHASLCRIICFFVYSIFSNIQVFAQCIDFTNLRSENVTCTYGSFSNPYQHIGIRDDGPNKISSRHTIHKNANETDPRTGNQLHTVPPGEVASVRLGSWNTGAEAESITYEYFVDPDETPILVIKYAAVMQDPNHTPEQQPHLKLEILDESNNLVDSYCGAFDFIASSSLGWNQSNDGVLWNDWTAVGLDLSDYKGQTVRIRFTNYDCERGGHYGYAYINISCQKKKIQSLTCGLNNMTTFSGPDGFDYMWYKMDGANKMYIGTDQEITVPTDETTYYCEVSQTGKPTCSFTLDFKATSTYLFEHTETICENDFCNFRGRKIHKPGVYYDSLIATTGCDSVYKLILKTNPTFFEEINATICDNEYYNFAGKHLNKPGVYYDSLVASTGCDSVIKLMLKVNPTYLFEHTETICNNEVYHFRGKQLNKSGVYYDSLMSMQGCDSIYKLNLTVYPTYQKDISVNICNGESYLFNGIEIKDSGVYLDTLTSINGCDSIVRLSLNINPTYFYEETKTICENDVYNFHGRKLNKPGVYYDSLIATTGCDSIYKLVLKKNPTYFFEKTISTCEDQPYYFAGKHLNRTGVYYDTLVSSNGCDSIHKLNLTVHPTYRKDISANICRGESYMFNGRELRYSGVYYDTLQTINGCDSIIRLMLNVNPTYLFEHTETICENDFCDFRGRKIHQPGVYYDSLIATTGCDSVYKLILKTNPTFFEEINATICDNEYYNFAGKHLNKPGVYYDSLVASTGCDSVIKLMLKVNPTYLFEHTETICNNEVYHFRGKQLNKSGVYYDSLMSMQGCDSVYKLNLIVLPDAIIENKELILCASELPYQWFDQTITKSGKYTMAEQYVATNCDSVVHVLTLQTYVQTLPSLITNPIARIGEAIDVSYSTDEILSHILMEPWYAPNAIVTWYIMDGNTWHILTDEPIKSDVSKITLKYIIDSDCGRVVSDEMIISVLTTKLKENLNCTTGTKKIFYNDQLIILRDGKTFSVIGQEM